MYLRTIGRRNKDGSEVRYVQLAHNEWDPARKCSIARVVHSFGREDQLDREALGRLVRSLSRVLEPEQALIATAPADLAFVCSVPLGGAWALDGLWRRLGIDRVVERLLDRRRLDPRAERLVFALVANRALAPGSKLSCCEWLAGDVAIPGLAADAVGEDPQPLYRMMDWLLEIEAELAEQVYWATADLLNLEVDLLFFDTTSTYFERDEPDGERVDEDGAVHPPFRTYGHSKDHRDELPQVVVGLAVTRTGIPIRAWCWPGNTGDQPLIRQVKDELREWKLSRVVWVADRGFQSAENRRYLQRAGGHYIIGEKLRGESREA
ncbi:MAG: IS1634 family transposase, partial [Actinobacteria bacterium]|nr:IS1634 family transposase [Actinomycetota bacterium]